MRNWPLFKTLSAAWLIFLLFAWWHSYYWRTSWLTFGGWWFAAGFFYTNLFEYCWHRWPMHVGLPGLHFVKRNHLRHHQIFQDENFQSDRLEDLAVVVDEWHFFPILFTPHYWLALWLLPIVAVSSFLLGVVVHFSLFEINHWCTHLKNNRFDALIRRLPFLDLIRTWQIEHHRLHHERPFIRFGFSVPPAIWDKLFKTFR